MNIFKPKISFVYKNNYSIEQIQMLCNTPLYLPIKFSGYKYKPKATYVGDKAVIRYERIWDNARYRSSFVPSVGFEYDNKNECYTLHVRIPWFIIIFFCVPLAMALYLVFLLIHSIWDNANSLLNVGAAIVTVIVLLAICTIPFFFNRYYAKMIKTQIDTILNEKDC